MSDAIIPSKELYEKLKSQPPEVRYKFGLEKLDGLTEGFALGELITITGYSGHGKTTMCQTLTTNLDELKMRVLWFSYELTQRQFLNKFAPYTSFYLPEKNRSARLDWIEKKIAEGIRKYQTNVIMIDHLHYLVDMMPESGMSQTQIIGDVCRRLKQMALNLNIAIFLIAHTKQPKEDKAPDLSSLRDSSFIAQESDAVYAINRIKKRGYSSDLFEADSYIYILKQRHTGQMGKRVRISYNQNRFTEAISPDEEKQIKV